MDAQPAGGASRRSHGARRAGRCTTRSARPSIPRPHVGSIGKAIDLAAPVLGGDWHPLLVAAPPIRRYQAFGNLFATVDGVGYRLDRHPTMSRHPMTPMDEADVRVHLARQTARPIGLVDLRRAQAGHGRRGAAPTRGADGAEIVAIDVLDDASLAEAGRLIWENRGAAAVRGRLARASNMRWSRTGARPGCSGRAAAAGGEADAARIAAVSGSLLAGDRPADRLGGGERLRGDPSRRRRGGGRAALGRRIAAAIEAATRGARRRPRARSSTPRGARTTPRSSP